MRRFSFARGLLVFFLCVLPCASVTAQTTDPEGTAGYHFLVARHLEGMGRIDEAIASLQRALKLLPESAELRAELSALYARQDKPVEALDMAEEALSKDPNNREANRILGSILAVLAEQKQKLRATDDPTQYQSRAIAALEKARGDGADLNLLLTLGRLQLRAGQHEKAIVSLRRIFEEQPQYTEGAMLLAAAQEGAGKLDDAAATIEAALEINPTFVRGHLKLIELYEEQRKWKEAAEAYARASEMNPRADLLGGHAAALINSGKAREARDLLVAGLAKRPKPEAGLLYLLAAAERTLRNFDAASAAARRLREAFPADRRSYMLEAQIAEESGRLPEAEKVLRELLSKDPLDADALNYLGYMLAERGEKLDEAVDLVQRALKVEPENPSFLDSLGWAYLKAGKLTEADKPLSEAAKQMPENSVIQDHLGELRFRQQRFADAVAAWQRALAGDGASIDRATVEKKLRDAQTRIKK
jgi:tetratricopeptide (TPR) repeat protein